MYNEHIRAWARANLARTYETRVAKAAHGLSRRDRQLLILWGCL